MKASILSTIQVGFSPALPGNSVISGTAAGATAAASGEAEGAMGFLDALLAALAPNLATPGADATGTTGTAGNPDAAAQQAAALALSSAVTNGETTPLPAPAVADAELAQLAVPQDVEELLGDLVDALAALDTGDADQPVDPALEQKLDEMVEALAGMLGIPLPTPPAIDPAITQAAAGPDAILAQATPAGEPAPAVPPAPSPTPSPVEPAEPGIELLPALRAAHPSTGADEPAPPDAAETSSQSGATAATAGDKPVPVPVDQRLARLVEKLERVAQRLEQVAPGLAAKLGRLQAQLQSPTTESEALVSRIGASLEDTDLDALTAPRTEARATAAPQPFTQPVLPNPAGAVRAGDTGTASPTPPVGDTAATPEAEADPAAPQPRLVAEPAAEPATEGPAPKDRTSFAQHLADAKADKPATVDNQPAPQQATIGQRTDAALAPRAVHAAYQAPVQQINMGQVAFEIVRQVHQGNNRFQIRLDPPELGRIDVRLQIDGDGNTQARMTVERAETLDLMQRDQRHLEKALAQAGLDSSKTTLEFSLRQNPNGREAFQQQFQNQQQGGQGQGWNRQGTQANGETQTELQPATQSYRGSLARSGVNLFV